MKKSKTTTSPRLSGADLSPEQRQALLDAYYASGENRCDFARKYGLPYNTLYAWTRKYPPGSITGRSAIKPLVNHRPSLPQPIFAQVDLADAPSSHPSNSGWELCLEGRATLRMGSNVDVDTVIKLLNGLEGGARC